MPRAIRNSKGFLAAFLLGFGAIYMMDMKEIDFKMNKPSQNEHGHYSDLHFQSKYNYVPEAAEVAVEHDMDTITMQKASNLNVEETHTTSTSVPTSNEPSAKPSESSTAPPSPNTKTKLPSSQPSVTPTMSKQEEEIIETTTMSSELKTCPEYKEQDSSLYPPGFPQVLRAGNYTSESSHPFLSKDIWAELVDNKRTFFLRPYEDGFPNRTTL
jgi:hypothetical protein